MKAFLERAILAAGRTKRSVSGGSMTLQVSNGKAQQILGGALLASGTGVLLVRASSLALHARNLLCAPTLDTAGALGEISLAVLHGLQMMAFDHAILFAAASNILVLFSALVVIAAGITLLRKRLAKALAQLSSPEPSTGAKNGLGA
jgi:hypothetical protein